MIEINAMTSHPSEDEKQPEKKSKEKNFEKKSSNEVFPGREIEKKKNSKKNEKTLKKLWRAKEIKPGIGVGEATWAPAPSWADVVRHGKCESP